MIEEVEHRRLGERRDGSEPNEQRFISDAAAFGMPKTTRSESPSEAVASFRDDTLTPPQSVGRAKAACG